MFHILNFNLKSTNPKTMVPSWKDDSVHYSTHFIWSFLSILNLQNISTIIELRAAV